MMTSYQRFVAKSEVFLDVLKVKEVQEVLGFFFVVSLVAPNLEEFLIYYNASKDVSALQEAYANVAMFAVGLVIILFYTNIWKKFEAKPLQQVAIAFRMISALFFMLEVSGRLGNATVLTPFQSLVINSFAMRSFVDAFMYVPGLIFYSKMVPHHIEGTMLGFALSIIKLNADVIGRCFTAGLNLHFNVKADFAKPEKTVNVTKIDSTIDMANSTILVLAGGLKGTDPLSPGLAKMYVV